MPGDLGTPLSHRPTKRLLQNGVMKKDQRSSPWHDTCLNLTATPHWICLFQHMPLSGTSTWHSSAMVRVLLCDMKAEFFDKLIRITTAPQHARVMPESVLTLSFSIFKLKTTNLNIQDKKKALTLTTCKNLVVSADARRASWSWFNSTKFQIFLDGYVNVMEMTRLWQTEEVSYESKLFSRHFCSQAKAEFHKPIKLHLKWFKMMM